MSRWRRSSSTQRRRTPFSRGSHTDISTHEHLARAMAYVSIPAAASTNTGGIGSPLVQFVGNDTLIHDSSTETWLAEELVDFDAQALTGTIQARFSAYLSVSGGYGV